MGVLGKFEQRLEELVRGGFAKVFRGQVEPVEIAAALQRECDQRKAVMGPGRVAVPNKYEVLLSSSDAERLLPFAGALSRELAAMIREHAEAEGWQFFGDVEVELLDDPGLDSGVFRVHGRVDSGEQGANASSGSSRSGGDQQAGDLRRRRPRLVISTGGDAMLGSGQADGNEVVHMLRSRTTVLGRSGDAGLRLTDTGISRLHAEVRLGDEGAELVDLGSTNGTLLNGRTVQRAPLHDGDRVRVGSTDLVFRLDG